MMTEKEFQEELASSIVADTINLDPKVPVHHYSAFIDGKLYRSIKGRSVWTRQCDVGTSFRYSNTFRTLEQYAEELCVEEHPEWFEQKDGKHYYPYGRPWVKSAHYRNREAFVENFITQWKKKHFEVREVFHT